MRLWTERICSLGYSQQGPVAVAILLSLVLVFPQRFQSMGILNFSDLWASHGLGLILHFLPFPVSTIPSCSIYFIQHYGFTFLTFIASISPLYVIHTQSISMNTSLEHSRN